MFSPSKNYHENRACLRHAFLLRFAIIDSSIKLFPRKKSVAIIFAAFHHSSLYHCVNWKIKWNRYMHTKKNSCNTNLKNICSWLQFPEKSNSIFWNLTQTFLTHYIDSEGHSELAKKWVLGRIFLQYALRDILTLIFFQNIQ